MSGANDPDGVPVRTRVLIAGGGIAAVEALLALGQLAPDLVDVTLLSPRASLELRPLSVATPFAATRERRNFPLEPLAREHGARLVLGTLAEVRPSDRVAVTTAGDPIAYDVLLVAVGAVARPALAHVLTFGAEPLVLNGLLADIEQGFSRRIAFVVPPGAVWSLPVYELALMTRRQAVSMAMDPEIVVITPEPAPLAVFGPRAGERVAALLDAAGIEVRTGAEAHVGPSGRVGIEPGGEILDFQRVVAMPVLEGPRIPGLPHDEDGFIPVDCHCRVAGLRDVYCAGDATDYPIKQGGLATQQADAAAQHIAALAGAAVRAAPFRPVLRGRLLTGGADEFFLKEVRRPAGEHSATPLWWPPTKVSGRYLTPWLASLDPDALPPEPLEHASPVERDLPTDPSTVRRAVLSLAPLGAPPPTRRS